MSGSNSPAVPQGPRGFFVGWDVQIAWMFGCGGQGCPLVIPGRPKGEPGTHDRVRHVDWVGLARSWVPGSSLREAPE